MQKIEIDPTIPTRVVPTAIGDVVLTLDFGVLMDSEARLIKQGHDVSLMQAFNLRSFSALREFFVIAAKHHQPELTYEGACKLVTIQNIGLLSDAIVGVYEAAMPAPPAGEGDGADPTQPIDEKAESNTGSGSSELPASTLDSASQSSGE
jgi:hypothetical protein